MSDQIQPTIREEVEFTTEQPDRPFSAVRLGMFYQCQCPTEWLEGRNALDMMLRLKEISAASGFTVIGEHHDLYGTTRTEMLANGWTINLTFSQSGASFDAWHIPRTVDINVHWCHEDPHINGPSEGERYEEQLLVLLEQLFKPVRARYKKRIYRVLEMEAASSGGAYAITII